MNSVADNSNARQNPLDKQPVFLTCELRKVYRTGFWPNQKVVFLKNRSLQVYPGKTFALLSPNGAGKTTLLKLLLGIIRPLIWKGIIIRSTHR
jgi:ABC-2 type transport system ATP-binding protein